MYYEALPALSCRAITSGNVFMILRRVIQHVKKQEWTAIWIDLVIVVAGVFIGIQVANWNDERERNKQSEVYTERLKADLREEAWGYTLVIEYNKDVLVRIESVLADLQGEAALSDEQFVINAFRATQYRVIDRKRATFDELISTSKIDLIKDQTLRNTAIKLYNIPMLDNLYNEGVSSEYRKLFRRTVSKDVQQALFDNCGDGFAKALDYTSIKETLSRPCTLGLPADKITAAAKALRTQDDMLAASQLRYAEVSTTIRGLENRPVIVKAFQEIFGRKP
jgi:hypothetical protein